MHPSFQKALLISSSTLASNLRFLWSQYLLLPKHCTTRDNIPILVRATLVLRVMGDAEKGEDPALVRKFVHEVGVRGLEAQLINSVVRSSYLCRLFRFWVSCCCAAFLLNVSRAYRLVALVSLRKENCYSTIWHRPDNMAPPPRADIIAEGFQATA